MAISLRKNNRQHAGDRVDLSDEKPIFIIGGGRSGTTLARYTLNAHPNIYIAEEISYYFWVNYFRGDLRTRLQKYFNTFSYVWLRQNPQNVMAMLPSDLGKQHFPVVYRDILKTKAQQYGRRRFGEKNPLLTIAMEQVFNDFPNAKVINLVRDPRANVFSHTTMPWSSRSLLTANAVVKANYKMAKKHGDRILHIKLEDLIENPKPTIATMLDFVEEPWSDNVLDHAKNTLPNEGIPFPWLREASRDRKSKSQKWTDGLSPAWIRLIEQTNREQMQRFGYAPHSPAQSQGKLVRMSAMLADVPPLIASVYRTLRLATLLAVTAPDDTWKVQSIMHSLNPSAWDHHPEWDEDLPQLPAQEVHR